MIVVNNIYKTYGTRTVLSGVTTRFPAGCLTSVIGPNAAGKTTLLMVMARLLGTARGEIALDGELIAQIPIGEYAKRVATLRQAPEFNLRLTVEDLVAFGRFPYSRGALTAADWLIIDEAIAFLSLDQIRRAYVDELSGGQRQMAFLAMTIAQQTKCLLLDEPLNNLDMRHAVQIMQALRMLCDDFGRTVIVVIHDINFAANYSDHIVAMKNGVIHSAGAVADVVTEDRLRDLYDLEFKILRNANGCLCNYFTPKGKIR